MERTSEESSSLIVSCLMVLAFAALTGLVYYGRPVLLPFVLAVFLFSMFSPTLDWLVLRLRFPRPLALTVSFLLVVIVATLAFLMTAEAVRRVIATASTYSDGLISLVERSAARLSRWGLSVEPETLTGDLKKSIPALVTSIASQGLNVVSTFSLVMIFLFFLMASRDPYEVHKGVYASIDRDVRRYLITKTALSAMMGISVAVVLWIFGVQLALVFGLLTFVLDFIPTIGSVVATLLPIPVALAQYPDSIWYVLLMVTILAIGQMIQGNVLQPKVLGNSLHLHPVIILLAISFWGLVWGLIGAFLAVPLTAIIRLVSLRIAPLRPLGYLLGGRMPDIDKPAAA